MPADYSSTAKALSLPLSPSPTPSPNASTTTRPPWAQPRPQSAARRLSTPYSRSSSSAHLPLGARILRTSTTIINRLIKLFLSLTPLQRGLAVVALLVSTTISIIFLIYSHAIFAWLAPVAKGWRELPGGWLIIFFMTCATGFPPMIGYSSCLTISGFVFGVWKGWPIVASATVIGSLGSFYTSRTIFSSYVDRLVGSDKRFVALGQVLRHDGLLVLAMIRLCPLPFSLSNGFLATIPSISPMSFAAATALATPKLLVHVFIGSRLALLAESGDAMSVGDKILNYVSMFFGGLLGLGIGLYVYRKTMARAQELAIEEADENGGLARVDRAGGDYEDLEEGLVDDAAAIMDDDDISLWDNDGGSGRYSDDFDEEEESSRNGLTKNRR